MRIRLAIGAIAILVSVVSRASDAPPTQAPTPVVTSPSKGAAVAGMEALCAETLSVVDGSVPAHGAVRMTVEAEGATLDIAEPMRERCSAVLVADGHPSGSSNEDALVRVRVRAAPPSLVALIDIGTFAAPGSLRTDSISVPLGAALEAWLSAAGTGVETWVAGTVDGEALALCGAGYGGQDTVGVVTADQVVFLRWTAAGLQLLTRLDLPAPLRARARSPAASAVCRSEEGTLVFAFGMHDRARGAVLRFTGGTATWASTLDGIPIGFDASGAPVLAVGVEGTSLIRWKERPLAQAVALAGVESKEGSATRVIGTTPEGALFSGEGLSHSALYGSGFAVADVDLDGHPDLIVSRSVLPGDGAEDRITVRVLDNPTVVRHESRALKGTVGPIGAVTDPTGARVLAVLAHSGHSQILAIGHRQHSQAP